MRPSLPVSYMLGFKIDMNSIEKEVFYLEESKKLCELVNRNLTDKIEAASLSHNSKLPFKALSLKELLIYRIADLSEVTLQLYEDKKLVSAIILTRSVFETSSILYWLRKRLVSAVETQELGNIDEFFMKHLFGTAEDFIPVDRYNVLTAIDHVDKDIENYRKSYDSLSEFAHPNWPGLMGAYGKADRKKYTLHLGKGIGEIPIIVALPLFAGSLKMAVFVYNEMEKTLIAFNELCDVKHRH